VKIFGIGLSRTGTSSLTIALRFLGYKIIHGPNPPLLPGLKATLNKVDGATDFPIALQYKELDKIYKKSKFILTTRPLGSWLKSCRVFLKYSTDSGAHNDLRTRMYGDYKFNKTEYTKAFIRYHIEVINYFKTRKKSFLILDITKANKWTKLCRFLDKRIPGRPFPHVFTSQEVKKQGLINEKLRKKLME